MLSKVLPLYQKAILFSSQPDHLSEDYYLFFDESEQEWMAIPKNNLTEPELNLLKTLYKLTDNYPTQVPTAAAKGWYEFLLKNGEPPAYNPDTRLRFIQFYLNDSLKVERLEFESALKGFFTEEVMIIWEDNYRGIVIEELNLLSQSEKELISISETLESDFYVKIYFYIGKAFTFSEQLPALFQQERDSFAYGQKYLTKTKIFSFERIFPAFAANHLPVEMKQKLYHEVAEVFTGDSEMFTTIKTFLEHNLNASLTAKKLYIHRNTLQYRIDKFVEKTGIGLKDFYGALTVFLACILYEQKEK